MLVRRLRRRRQPEGGLPVDALPTCRIGDHIDCRNDRRVRGPCIDSLPVEPAGRGPNRRKLRSKDGVRCGPLAGCATLISIEEFVLVAQNVRGGGAAASVVGFRRWLRRRAGRGLGSLSRFADAVESVCCGGPQSSVGCDVRGRPSVIASPGSLQRPPARTGKDRAVRSKERSRAQEVQAPQSGACPKWATTPWPTRRATAGSTTAPS